MLTYIAILLTFITFKMFGTFNGKMTIGKAIQGIIFIIIILILSFQLLKGIL